MRMILKTIIFIETMVLSFVAGVTFLSYVQLETKTSSNKYRRPYR